jgi:UDP-N-acetylglucosamine 2-epimerase (non-hydrolysing)
MLNELCVRVWALRAHGAKCTTIFSGQHRDLGTSALQALALVPDVDLDAMTIGQRPTDVAARLLERLPPQFERLHPDWVLVQGDTTTAMAAAVAAFHCGIRVGHVEAGLRSHRNREPFPEEMNRRVIDVVADLAFAPTVRAEQNLLREGVPPERIKVTGNTAVDAAQRAATQEPTLSFQEILAETAGKQMVLITAHRRESFGEPIRNIFLAVRALARKYVDTRRFIVPVHPNPEVQDAAREILKEEPGLYVTEPIDYVTMIQLLKRAHLVLTDSGGLQEEAPSFGVPVLVLRDVTERPEAIEAGCAEIVGTNADRIVSSVSRLLDDPDEHSKMRASRNPFGDGHAADCIADALLCPKILSESARSTLVQGEL